MYKSANSLLYSYTEIIAQLVCQSFASHLEGKSDESLELMRSSGFSISFNYKRSQFNTPTFAVSSVAPSNRGSGSAVPEIVKDKILETKG